MMNLNCEYVRDVYPDLLNGRAESSVVQAVQAHLAVCEECRAEAQLIEALHARPLAVPAGLQERVLRAAQQPRQPRLRFRRSDIAMAATLAAALIGGGAYLQLQQRAPVPQPAAHAPAHGVGSVGVEDALLSGKSSLDDLSVEQLEKLLGEVQS